MPALFLIVFVDLVGFGIIIPLLPFYGEYLQATPAEVGLLMASYSLAQLVAAPLWGRLSDRVGRKPVLVVSLAGIALAYVWLAFADGLWELFAARLTAGAMAGNIGVAFAYVADVTRPEDRARGMGLIGAAFGLGFILGPAIGGILAGADPMAPDYRTPALTAAALSLTALCLTIAVLKESLTASDRARHQASASAGRLRAMRQSFSRPEMALPLGLLFLASLVFAGMETTFAMWSRRQFGWGPLQNGYLFAYVGLLTALFQGVAVGRLARRFGEDRLVGHGALALAAGMVLIPLASSVPLLLVAMTAVAWGFSLVSPALNSLVSLHVDAGMRGGAMGIARSVVTLARVLGPIGAGALFHFLGRDWPYFTGAAVMLVVVVLARRLGQVRDQAESGSTDRDAVEAGKPAPAAAAVRAAERER
ncbi:MAG: MFS transporter [Rhodospirillales bacterium]|nr:MAG: MFS transporter [Rhodospirillales bacterium]